MEEWDHLAVHYEPWVLELSFDEFCTARYPSFVIGCKVRRPMHLLAYAIRPLGRKLSSLGHCATTVASLMALEPQARRSWRGVMIVVKVAEVIDKSLPVTELY